VKGNDAFVPERLTYVRAIAVVCYCRQKVMLVKVVQSIQKMVIEDGVEV
jgi:hypothetical protein